MENRYSFEMPDHACNAHLHIIDMRYTHDPNASEKSGTLDNYKSVAKMIQIPRAIFVQAKVFALDNTCLLDAIDGFGAENCRGIAVVNNYVSDRELGYLHSRGIRGLRFSLWNPPTSVVKFGDIKPLSERIKDLGWNIQLHMQITQMVEHANVLENLNCRVVIDHMARLDPRLGTNDPNYAFIKRLIDKGNTWVKLSGPYLNTASAFPWEDASAVAREIATYAPERVLFGTDFPNTLEKHNLDPISLVEMLRQWIPDEKKRKLALVDNPQEVYFD